MVEGVTRTFLPAPPPAPGRPRLVVTGFMGTGKTEAGRAAADRLGMPFVDLDRGVERRAGMSVAEIFVRRGEDSFRQAEREIVEEAARLSGAVIATGGGAVLHADAFRRLAHGAVVAVLTCDPAELVRRLAPADGRPLLGDDPSTRVAALLDERAEAYAAAGPPLDTTSLSAEQTATHLAERYREVAGDGRSVTIPVPGPDRTYPAVLREGVIDRLGDVLGRILPAAVRAALVVDAGVDEPWGRRAALSLAGAGIETGPPIRLPAGEEAKTAAEVQSIWTSLRELGLGRDDPVVAVGGGAALDAAGFAAATYNRGVPLINVPTTLLAMVDAGLGGKVGIDHAGVKNLVGAFHHPSAVLVDLGALGTLPPRALRAGLAECVKAAVAASPLALHVMETLPLDDQGGPDHLGWIAEQAVRVKAGYVGADPFDRELRHALNLGHTFAHAIESATGYGVLHGEAVAMGLVAAARLGAWLGTTDQALAGRLESLLGRWGLPVRPPEGVEPGPLLHALGADKKKRGGRVAFVLPCPGGVDLVTGLDPDQALAALEPEGSLAR